MQLLSSPMELESEQKILMAIQGGIFDRYRQIQSALSCFLCFGGMESDSLLDRMMKVANGIGGMLSAIFFVCLMFGMSLGGSLLLSGLVAKYLLQLFLPVISSVFAVLRCLVDDLDHCFIVNSIIVSAASYSVSLLVGSLVHPQLRRAAGRS